ncbi:uncharacterized protein LACBIDRAFT_321541 [Laccaria bicolor S238N-H82]|uniref:Predicted protein n=1 Tax=Laccaria bicolor (strain S238N-H82 / ATCC MYA-4686) TaxID=486041 RepID=B0CTB1_LACBS|nr:uncharacterized protein LACBIDRAFT_321541 [Laccaria bicolor S238N-H82]EDR14465.1 predicted protein [Laccaria bicolor S238N-H82]|eukprot:XP_001875024.1 predicted protein [Laccaria bicolor S238N-H82]
MPGPTTQQICTTVPTVEGLRELLFSYVTMPTHWQQICITVPTAEGLRRGAEMFHREIVTNCITVPTVEGLRQGAEMFHREIVLKHPFLLASGLVLLAYNPKSPFAVVYYVVYGIPKAIIVGLLHCLGFGRSYAAGYQSRVYKGIIPRSSTFSASQSSGARGGTFSKFWLLVGLGFGISSLCFAVGWGFMVTLMIVYEALVASSCNEHAMNRFLESSVQVGSIYVTVQIDASALVMCWSCAPVVALSKSDCLLTNYSSTVDMDPSSSTAAAHNSRGPRIAEKEKGDRNNVRTLSLNLIEARDIKKSEAIPFFSAKFWELILELLRYHHMKDKYDQAKMIRDKHQRDLEAANAKMKRLQAENEYVVDFDQPSASEAQLCQASHRCNAPGRSRLA